MNTFLEAKKIINGKPFDKVINLPNIDKRFSYGALKGDEGENLVDLNFKDILLTIRNMNGVAKIVNYEQYDENDQFDSLHYVDESKVKKIVSESLKKVLKEWEFDKENNAPHIIDNDTSIKLNELRNTVTPSTDYEGNDLNYENLYDEAYKIVYQMGKNGEQIKWVDVANRMGFHLETLNEADLELLHDAIEDAMADMPKRYYESKNMKNTVKLNESHLKKIVAESVKRVLKEGYFGRRISQGGSRDTDFYDIDNGEDISEPGNKYAMKDAAENAPEWDSKMYDLKRQTVGKGKDTLDYDSDWLEDDPMTKFDMAAQKHAMRDIRNTSDLNWRNAGAAIAVAKLGIPMSIAYKLSNETLGKILKDMGISYKSNYRKKIS